MLQNLGPGGDYNDILCMYMTDETSGTERIVKGGPGDYVDDDGFKLEAVIDEELSVFV